MTRWIDTHVHLHCEHFHDDRAAVLARARGAGVARMIEVGYDLHSSRAALALAHEHPDVYAVVGVQPNHAHEALPGWLEQVAEMAASSRVVAIGEIGFDFYRNYAPPDLQERVFEAQLRLARDLHLPVVIHSRDALDETLRVLRSTGRGIRGVMHSFSGTYNQASRCIDSGFAISLSGPVTFAKAVDLHDVARRVPLDVLLTETDCPYLSPHPFRGKRNEPARVALVAERIAALRQCSTDEVADAVWDNAERVFCFDAPAGTHTV